MNRRQFWLLDAAWPKESPDWVFLGRAVQRMGRMLKPDAWRADDPSWDIAEIPRDDDGSLRALSAFMRIASDCSAGVLESGIRPVPGGGEVNPLPPSVWMTEYHRLSDRFVFCQMRINDPFTYGVGGIGPQKEKGMGYIFIGRAGLDRITWPTQKAIRAAFPEGLPQTDELSRDEGLRRRWLRLTAGFDEHSLVYRALGKPKAPVAAKRGRKKGSTKYDWPNFRREAIRRLDHEGGISLEDDPGFKQSTLESHMADWCSSTWGVEPARSQIRDHVVKAIEVHRKNNG